MRRAIYPAVLLATLVGCYTPYVATYTTDSATVIVHNASKGKMSASIYSDATACTGRSMLAPMLVGGERRTIFLRTDREVAISTGQDLGIDSRQRIGCVNALSFTPQSGHTYLLGVGARQACSMEMSEIGPGSQPRHVPVEVQHREFHAPLTESGEFCTRRGAAS
jgi:hypothetical protein